jgi:hypothetical protein
LTCAAFPYAEATGKIKRPEEYGSIQRGLCFVVRIAATAHVATTFLFPEVLGRRLVQALGAVPRAGRDINRPVFRFVMRVHCQVLLACFLNCAIRLGVFCF